MIMDITNHTLILCTRFFSLVSAVIGLLSMAAIAAPPAGYTLLWSDEFNGTAGTEVWLDIDHTSIPLNSVVELLDGDGNVLARSDDSHTEKAAGVLPVVIPAPPTPVKAFPQPKAPAAFGPRDSQGGLSKDTFTQNPFDAGFRVTLPGTAGEQGVFHVRVRSSSGNLTNVFGGLTDHRRTATFIQRIEELLDRLASFARLALNQADQLIDVAIEGTNIVVRQLTPLTA